MNGPEQNIYRAPEPLHVCVCRLEKVVPDALYVDGRFIVSDFWLDVESIARRFGEVAIVLEFRWVANCGTWPESLSELRTLTRKGGD